MKTLPIITISMLVLLGGCREWLTCRETVRGSGTRITKTFPFTDFNGIMVDHIYNLTVTQGDEYLVQLTMDDNLEPFLEIQESLRKARFSLQDGMNYTDLTLDLNITLPDLDLLDINGAASCEINQLSNIPYLEINASGASHISGSLTADRLEIGVSGASTLEVRGSADSIDLDASGASDVYLADLEADKVDAGVSGASSVKIYASKSLIGDVSGASKLKYWGNPGRVDISTSGAASAKNMQR